MRGQAAGIMRGQAGQLIDSINLLCTQSHGYNTPRTPVATVLHWPRGGRCHWGPTAAPRNHALLFFYFTSKERINSVATIRARVFTEIFMPLISLSISSMN